MEPTHTARVLNAIETLYDKHLVYPSPEERDAAVAWTLASWVAESFDNFPRLYFSAAEFGAGKSVAAEMVGRLSRESHEMVNVTPAILYRLIENAEKPPTLFVDEADNIFGTAGSSSSHQELLGVMNKGFHRNGTVYRARGTDDVQKFRCFSPMILAGKGILPRAMMTRSITVRMRRPIEGETFVPYRERVHRPFFDAVKEAIDKWVGSQEARSLGMEFPELPGGIKDRDADVWEPLVMVGDLAGGEWSERIRKAAVTLTNRTDHKDEVPIGTKFVDTLKRLLKDTDKVPMDVVAEELKVTTRSLGKLAREMGIDPGPIGRVDGKPAKGFTKEQYADAFHV